MSQQIFNKMHEQQQFPFLLSQLNNLPLHLLLTILPYLDRETKFSIKKNSTLQHNNDQTFLKLISLSLFSQKYLTSTDRSVYMSFYSQPTFLEYENIFFGEICVRDPNKYFQLEKQVELLFQSIGSELKNLESSQSLIQFLQNAIRDPQIPLPRMRKEGKAMHCNSSLQFGLADLRNVDEDGKQEEYVEDCVLDLEEFLETRESVIQKVVRERKGRKIKGKSLLSAIKQCYYHPELISIQNYKQYVIDQLTNYNLFIYVHALVSGVAQIFHEYIVDQGKQFQRFIQFILRYSIYRSMVLTLQQSKISSVLYAAMRNLINKVQEFNRGLKIKEEDECIKLFQAQDVIFQVDSRLENKRSKESQADSGNQCFRAREIKENIDSSRMSNRNGDMCKDTDIEMSSRMFLAGGKIWVNQCRKIKQKYEQESISPSKHVVGSQQKINSQQYLKIFNRLSYNNIRQRLSKQIQQIGQTQKKKQTITLRDQDIINVFGFNSNSSNSSQFTYSFNQSSTSDFDQALARRKSIHNDQSYHYRNALLNVQNKIRMHPYRHASPRVKKCNDSKSPQKQYESMAQIQMNNLKQLPSLKQRKLLSRASILSKYSKITDLKGISFIQDLFESQIQIQEQILMDFFSFLVDLSVNECTVHWCGHSQQFLMGDYYRAFQDYVIKYNIGFMEHLSKLAEEACTQLQIQNKKMKMEGSHQKTENTTQKVLRNLLKWHLQYLDMGYLHKTTIKKLLKKGNEILEKTHIMHQVETKQKQFEPIKLNIDQLNKIIEYYNEEMWKIQRNVCEEKLKIYEERRFYKIMVRMPRFEDIQDYKERGEEKQIQKNHFLERSQEIFIQKQHKKLERRRRNSEQVSPLLSEQ